MSDWTPKVGDKARCVKNNVHARKVIGSAEEYAINKMMEPGDVFEIHEVYTVGGCLRLVYHVFQSIQDWIWAEDCEPVTSETTGCSCPTWQLMHAGCTCGQIQRERSLE